MLTICSIFLQLVQHTDVIRLMITCLEMIDFKICMFILDIFSSMHISENLKRIGCNVWKKYFPNLQNVVKLVTVRGAK